EAARQAEEARSMARQERDPEMAAYLRDEEETAGRKAAELQRQLETLLLPKDPNDDKDVVVEIRAGTGGQEASLFAGDLYDVFRSSGPGGQSVNTTDSAVRVTHKPTGIVISVQEERSQRQNREKAMRYLRARLLKAAQEEQQRQEAAARKAQVGTGERSEKIRTYNFPQNRVTDHRIGVSIHNLPAVMEGDLDEFVNA